MRRAVAIAHTSRVCSATAAAQLARLLVAIAIRVQLLQIQSPIAVLLGPDLARRPGCAAGVQKPMRGIDAAAFAAATVAFVAAITAKAATAVS